MAPGPDGERRDGEAVTAPPRRRRRAVGPAGAPPAVPSGPASWPDEPAPAEDDDERFLREVPPHHGG